MSETPHITTIEDLVGGTIVEASRLEKDEQGEVSVMLVVAMPDGETKMLFVNEIQ